MQETLPVAAVVVGQRIRKSPGNLLALAESIRQLGMLHPVVVNARNELLAGGRRLEAAKSLGWQEVPVRRVDTLDDAVRALLIERDENTCRNPLSMAEILALGKKLEELEQPEAARRKARPGQERSGKLPEQGATGDTRDKVAAALGTSGKTYEKAKAVQAAAEKDPERFGPVMEEMIRTGNVSRAYQQVKQETQDPVQAVIACAKEVKRAMGKILALRAQLAKAGPEAKRQAAELLESAARAILAEVKAMKAQ